jgi:hypothetical protein
MDVHISILLESKYLLRDITLYIPLDDSLDILNIAVSEGSCNTDGAKKIHLACFHVIKSPVEIFDGIYRHQSVYREPTLLMQIDQLGNELQKAVSKYGLPKAEQLLHLLRD